jgi:uncharacterized damage-inducible protein DinB
MQPGQPSSRPEPWLRGPLPDIDPLLMPAAHALMQVSEDVPRATAGLTPAQLWMRPGGAASVGFHLRHLAGSIDRLLTYAAGGQLDDRQRAALAAETQPPPPDALPELRELDEAAQAALGRALDVLRQTPTATLDEPRRVGRAGLPSTVLGLLFHVAEHSQRHCGQIVTTAKIVRGLQPGD